MNVTITRVSNSLEFTFKYLPGNQSWSSPSGVISIVRFLVELQTPKPIPLATNSLVAITVASFFFVLYSWFSSNSNSETILKQILFLPLPVANSHDRPSFPVVAGHSRIGTRKSANFSYKHSIKLFYSPAKNGKAPFQEELRRVIWAEIFDPENALRRMPTKLTWLSHQNSFV